MDSKVNTRPARSALRQFLHTEAASGVLLLASALIALWWANSALAPLYDHILHFEIAGASVHFLVNDGLMTLFFFLVGLEIRREIHGGALQTLKLASLPLIAASGGVLVPALLYLALNDGAAAERGWAVPTATDIAFAVGVLALLGRRASLNLRVLLLALAIIDDMAAVLIIAFAYSDGVSAAWVAVAAAGVAIVVVLQRLGLRSALVYIFPGAIVWYGLLKAGIHPTLAGVALGLLTPAVASPRHAETVAPVDRLQALVHPWSSFAVMPLFALANAGVALGGLNLEGEVAQHIAWGIFAALVLGKPVGVFVASALAVATGLATLPEGVTWRGVAVVGCLAGIGFTMSIFIAQLAFPDPQLLATAKFAVLMASAVAGAFSLAVGYLILRPRKD